MLNSSYRDDTVKSRAHSIASRSNPDKWTRYTSFDVKDKKWLDMTVEPHQTQDTDKEKYNSNVEVWKAHLKMMKIILLHITTWIGRFKNLKPIYNIIE